MFIIESAKIDKTANEPRTDFLTVKIQKRRYSETDKNRHSATIIKMLKDYYLKRFISGAN
jgi:hypothetical protein